MKIQKKNIKILKIIKNIKKYIQKIGFVSKFRAIKLKISPRGYFCIPRRAGMVPGSPEPLNDEKNQLQKKN